MVYWHHGTCDTRRGCSSRWQGFDIRELLSSAGLRGCYMPGRDPQAKLTVKAGCVERCMVVTNRSRRTRDGLSFPQASSDCNCCLICRVTTSVSKIFKPDGKIK